MHSGMFGGAAPDALVRADPHAGLAARRATATRRSTGSTRRRRGTASQYAAEQFRADANVLDGVELIGDGSVADMLWARPPSPCSASTARPSSAPPPPCRRGARARVSLRVPPGVDAAGGQERSSRTSRRARPWGVRCDDRARRPGRPVRRLARPARRTTSMRAAMEVAYGRAMQSAGQGGSIPLCNAARRRPTRRRRSS